MPRISRDATVDAVDPNERTRRRELSSIPSWPQPSTMSDQQPTSEDPPVASSSSAAPPVIKFKFGVDPNLILNEPRKRPREVTYTYGGSKPAAPVKQEVYQEPAFVIEKGQKLIDAVKNAREDEYDE